MWFQRFADRLEHEKQVIASLIAEGWVKRADWDENLQTGTVRADVDFEAGGQLREAKLIFPFVYPYCPLQVMPREEGARWSGHQWPSGELCLEIRADNWHPGFDAKDMLVSARKLLDTESEVDDAGAMLQVQSDHQWTEGQYLASALLRFVVSDALVAEVAKRGSGAHWLEIHGVLHDDCYVFFAVGLTGSAEHDRWIDDSVPPDFSDNPNRFARIAMLEEGDGRHVALFDRYCDPAELWEQFSAIPFDGNSIVVGLLKGHILAKWLGEKTYNIVEVPMDNQQRTLDRNDSIAGRRVAIVGCGSMGSKVAASLARAGVTRFFLADGDVMKIANIVRNDLDWNAVGAHKVDAVAKRLRAIRPDVQIDTWIGRLGGQHSTSNLVSCLEQLAACDLIVEATASGQGFGFVAAVATPEEIPMVWGRVFGGGYGGYVTRCRPGLERSPLDVRHEIHSWLTQPDFPKPPKDSDIDYGCEPDDQAPMIADDADVSVISAHLARMVLDTLRSPTESDYPCSAYVIGLRSEWIFDSPFQTFPVTLQPPTPSEMVAIVETASSSNAELTLR